MVRNPVGGDLWEASAASAEDATKAVEAAQSASPSWSKLGPAEQRYIVWKAAEILERRFSGLAEYQKLETGAEDLFIEWTMRLTIENLKGIAGKCSALSGSIPASFEEGRAALVLKELLGVVLGIAPW